MKSRSIKEFLVLASLISLSMSVCQRCRRTRHSNRLRRQELSQNVPMEWVQEHPYSEEEGIGNAVDKINAEDPILPPAPEVPIVPPEPKRTPEDGQRAPGDPMSRSNDDYMADFMKEMGIPPEEAMTAPVEGAQEGGQEAGQGSAPADQEPVDLSKLVEICDQPVLIAAANRYSNTTIRLFRNSDYWDLMSLPDRQAFVSKRMKLWPPLAPVTMKTSILTVLSGPMKDMTYKFSKNVFWSWNDTIGQQVSGGKGGELWMDLPPDASDGFDTMFHNDNESDPMIIAFKGDKGFEFIGDEKGYESKGRANENWPKGVTAAFTYPLADGVVAYLFREDKHCVRPLTRLKSGKDCDEWRENSELFGCTKLFEAPEPETKPPVGQKPDTSQTQKTNPDPEPEPQVKGEEEVTTPGNSGHAIGTRLVASVAIVSLLFTKIFN